MKIKRTYIAFEEVELKLEDGSKLREIAKDFQDGKIDDVNSLMYLVERNADHDVFYGVQFNLDDTNPKEVFRDIYISSHVIDYTRPNNELIEIEDDVSGNFSKEFVETLFTQLENKPCVSLYSLEKAGFDYIGRRGFSRTNFHPEVKLLG